MTQPVDPAAYVESLLPEDVVLTDVAGVVRGPNDQLFRLEVKGEAEVIFGPITVMAKIRDLCRETAWADNGSSAHRLALEIADVMGLVPGMDEMLDGADLAAVEQALERAGSDAYRRHRPAGGDVT